MKMPNGVLAVLAAASLAVAASGALAGSDAAKSGQGGDQYELQRTLAQGARKLRAGLDTLAVRVKKGVTEAGGALRRTLDKAADEISRTMRAQKTEKGS